MSSVAHLFYCLLLLLELSQRGRAESRILRPHGQRRARATALVSFHRLWMGVTT